MKNPNPTLPPPMENCIECGKLVPDDEWVANWMSCHECFNEHLDKYFAEHPPLPDFEL